MLKTLKKFPEALAYLKTFVTRKQQVSGLSDTEVLNAKLEISQIVSHLGQKEEAIKMYK